MCKGASKQTQTSRILARRDSTPPGFEIPGSATVVCNTWVRERERERQRERERERERDRETERQSEQRERERDRQTDRQTQTYDRDITVYDCALPHTVLIWVVFKEIFILNYFSI